VRTPKYLLADHLLAGEGGVDAWVAARRATGRSWRLIARELYVATQGRVDVTAQTLHNWFSADNGAAA
jgi:hypothetical protein